jgi:hypothetical protein
VLKTTAVGRTKKVELEMAAKRLKLSSETIMKKLLLIVALLAVVGFSSQAYAGVRFGVGIGVGPGYYGPAYGYPYYGYPYGAPYYYGGPAIYYGPGYYPWYHGYWHGGYYRGYHHRR